MNYDFNNLQRILKEYVKTLDGKSEHTKRSYLSIIHQFETYRRSKFVDQTLSLAKQISLFLKHAEVNLYNKKSTINLKYYALNSWKNYVCKCEGIFEESIAYEIQVSQSTKPNIITLNEIHQLLSKVERQEDRLVLECLKLEVNDVQLETKHLVIKHGKGRKKRAVPIVEPLVMKLQQLVKVRNETATDLLFLNAQQKPYNAAYLNRLLNRITQSLGWEKHITCHSFRHSFATNLINKGANTPTVAYLLGHKDYRVITSSYIHIAEPVMEEAIKLLM